MVHQAADNVTPARELARTPHVTARAQPVQDDIPTQPLPPTPTEAVVMPTAAGQWRSAELGDADLASFDGELSTDWLDVLDAPVRP
jgi:hypothetical protein